MRVQRGGDFPSRREVDQFGQVADAVPLDVGARGNAVDHDAPAGWIQEPHQQRDERRFAGAVRTGDADDFAPPHFHRKIDQRIDTRRRVTSAV